MLALTLENGPFSGHNILVVCCVWLCWVTALSIYNHYLSPVPIVDRPWFRLFGGSKPTKQLLLDAYNSYSKKSRVFRQNNHYILPPSTFDETRKVPSSIFSTSESIEASLFLKYFLGNDHTDVVNFVRQSVSSNINNLVPIIQDEIRYILGEHFPPKDTPAVVEKGEEWYPIRLHSQLLAGIGCIASRMFVGKRYARNPLWTRTASDWANTIIFQGLFLRRFPEPVVALMARFMPAMRRFRLLKDMLQDEVMDYITQGIQTESVGVGASTEDGDIEEMTLLPLLVKYVKDKPAYKAAAPDKVLHGVLGRLMGLMFAAIDTTTMTSTGVILDLVSNPRSEYAEPIRAEIDTVSAKHGGVWTQQALGELRLLDSFIKESQRMHAIGLVLPGRMVIAEEGYTFRAEPKAQQAGTTPSSPIHVPYRSTVFFPLAGVHYDPALYENPDSFHGFRFAADAVPSSQPSNKFLSFGHGTHACPGRHLALVVVKLLIIELLYQYEWRELEQRPKDWNFGAANVPDLKAEIHVRRVE